MFDSALTFVLEREGGYIHDLDDPGGATNQGITQVTYDTFRARQNLPPYPVKDILPAEVAAIYREDYWNAGRCYEMPWPLALVHFDGCVNHGIKTAGSLLQRVVGAKPDGVVGPQTLAAVQRTVERGDVYRVCLDLIFARLNFYRRIPNNKPTSIKFVPGWVARMCHLYDTVMGR